MHNTIEDEALEYRKWAIQILLMLQNRMPKHIWKDFAQDRWSDLVSSELTDTKNNHNMSILAGYFNITKHHLFLECSESIVFSYCIVIPCSCSKIIHKLSCDSTFSQCSQTQVNQPKIFNTKYWFRKKWLTILPQACIL